MSDEHNPDPQPSTPDPKPAKTKSAESRQAQARQAKARLAKADNERNGAANVNPIATDETYGALRDENRVVMRHNIALNLESFRAATDDFVAHPGRTYPPLRTTAAPFFSIIIPNFNGVRFLPTLLTTLRAQTFQDFELILIDDASSDESVSFVETHFPEVRLLVNRTNLGFARSCNLAVDAARGRLMVLLNNDTEPEPTWLEELAKAACANPQAAIIASKMLLFNERHKLHTTGDLMGSDGLPRNRGVWEEDEGQYDDDLTIFSGSGGGSAFRKDVWQQLGGFDEEFWMYLEDVDYAYRAHLLGWQAVFAPKARLYHHLSATGGGALASYYVGRNTIWTIAKNTPASLLWVHWLEILIAQGYVLLNALNHIRGEAARARIRGQLAGVWGLPRQLRKRQQIQARKTVTDTDLAEQLIYT